MIGTTPIDNHTQTVLVLSAASQQTFQSLELQQNKARGLLRAWFTPKASPYIAHTEGLTHCAHCVNPMVAASSTCDGSTGNTSAIMDSEAHGRVA